MSVGPAPVRPARGRVWRVIVGILIAIVVVLGVLAGVTGLRALSYDRFWKDRAAEHPAPDAFVLLALGDSATVAVGALDPMNGYVGRASALITERTGRPVHIVNLAVGGATTGDVIETQLPGFDPADADLVLIGTSNDLDQRVPLDRYREHLETLLSAVPAERTVMSDLPLLPGRDPYQAVFAEVADRHGIARADFAAVFTGDGHRLDIFSLLPPHLNDLGYGYWFEAYRPGIESILDGTP